MGAGPGQKAKTNRRSLPVLNLEVARYGVRGVSGAGLGVGAGGDYVRPFCLVLLHASYLKIKGMAGQQRKSINAGIYIYSDPYYKIKIGKNLEGE